MKVGVYGQKYSKESAKYIATVFSELEKHNAEIVVEENFLNQINQSKKQNKEYTVFNQFSDLNKEVDLFLSIGGDGTFLRAITYVRNLNIPLLGINLGRLGFLATVPKNKIKLALQAFINKEYSIKERTILKVNSIPKMPEFEDINIALNEITVVRKDTTAMITIETSLNNEFLSNYWADGLIVSTPTGSTGYSLSCGGPVIAPSAKNLVITPIAPHNLNVRPLVIADDTKISLKLIGREKQALISLDSRILTIPTDTQIYVEKADFNIQIVQLNNQSFLKTLRKKLLWGKDVRNR